MESKYLWILGLVLVGLLLFHYTHSYINPVTKFTDGSEFNKYMIITVEGSPGNEGKYVKLENLPVSGPFAIVDTSGRAVPYTPVGGWYFDVNYPSDYTDPIVVRNILCSADLLENNYIVANVNGVYVPTYTIKINKDCAVFYVRLTPDDTGHARVYLSFTNTKPYSVRDVFQGLGYAWDTSLGLNPEVDCCSSGYVCAADPSGILMTGRGNASIYFYYKNPIDWDDVAFDIYVHYVEFHKTSGGDIYELDPTMMLSTDKGTNFNGNMFYFALGDSPRYNDPIHEDQVAYYAFGTDKRYKYRSSWGLTSYGASDDVLTSYVAWYNVIFDSDGRIVGGDVGFFTKNYSYFEDEITNFSSHVLPAPRYAGFFISPNCCDYPYSDVKVTFFAVYKKPKVYVTKPVPTVASTYYYKTNDGRVFVRLPYVPPNGDVYVAFTPSQSSEYNNWRALEIAWQSGDSVESFWEQFTDYHARCGTRDVTTDYVEFTSQYCDWWDGKTARNVLLTKRFFLDGTYVVEASASMVQSPYRSHGGIAITDPIGSAHIWGWKQTESRVKLDVFDDRLNYATTSPCGVVSTSGAPTNMRLKIVFGWNQPYKYYYNDVLDGSCDDHAYQSTPAMFLKEWGGSTAKIRFYSFYVYKYYEGLTYEVERQGDTIILHVHNSTDTPYYDISLAASASDLGLEGNYEPVFSTTGAFTNSVVFDPGYDGTWTTKKFYLLYDTTAADVARLSTPGLDVSNVGEFSVSFSQPRDVSLYPGYSTVEVSPVSNAPGDYTFTVHLSTENPDAPDYAECEWNIEDPLTHVVTTAETNGPLTQSVTFTLSNEGVYVVNYTCHIFFTEPITGSTTQTIVIENPSVPSLSLAVSGVPASLSAPSEATITVSVTSDGSPVEGVNVYLTLNGRLVDQNTTDENGMATFTLTLSPGDVLKVSAYKSGYHPVEEEYTISLASGGGTGGVGGGTGGAGGTPVPSTTPSQPVTETAPTVQPASPTTGGFGVSSTVVLAILVVLAVLYFMSRR